MGVEVHNTMSMSFWIKEHFIKKLSLQNKNKNHEAGRNYEY